MEEKYFNVLVLFDSFFFDSVFKIFFLVGLFNVIDFDTFCKCYAPEKDEKLNGIVVKPVGEVSNMFIAC